jgi:hypothetical protein
MLELLLVLSGTSGRGSPPSCAQSANGLEGPQLDLKSNTDQSSETKGLTDLKDKRRQRGNRASRKEAIEWMKESGQDLNNRYITDSSRCKLD